MSDAPMPDHTASERSPAAARAEALSWLAGRYRWERLLADLHELAEREAAPVVDLPPERAREDTSAA